MLRGVWLRWILDAGAVTTRQSMILNEDLCRTWMKQGVLASPLVCRVCGKSSLPSTLTWFVMKSLANLHSGILAELVKEVAKCGI